MGTGGLPAESNDMGRRSAVSVLGRSLIAVVAIVSATCLLITIVIALTLVSPMIAWYVLRGDSEPAEVAQPKKKQEYVNLNIDQILGVESVFACFN